MYGALVFVSVSFGSHRNFIECSLGAEMADQLTSSPVVPLLMITDWPLQTW